MKFKLDKHKRSRAEQLTSCLSSSICFPCTEPADCEAVCFPLHATAACDASCAVKRYGKTILLAWLSVHLRMDFMEVLHHLSVSE